MKFYFFSFSLTRNCYYYDDEFLGLLRLRETCNALRLPVFFFSFFSFSFFLQALSGILGNSEQKAILQITKKVI